jgi:TRAP-type C4-dicarboxylate transport system permease small subunit
VVALGLLIWASMPLFGLPARTVSPATGIRLGWVYLALPVGGTLAVLFLVARLARLVMRGEPGSGGGEAPAGTQRSE